MMTFRFDFKDFNACKPTENKDYLCITYTGNIVVLQYNTKHELFNVIEREDTNEIKWINVAYWAEIKDKYSEFCNKIWKEYRDYAVTSKAIRS